MMHRSRHLAVQSKTLWRQLNAVNLQNYGQAPWLFKVLVLALVVVFVLGFSWLLLIRPALVERESLASKQLTLLSEYDDKYQQARQLSVFKNQMLELNGQFAGVLEQLPNHWQTAVLVEHMHTQAMSAGVQIEDVVIENPQSSPEEVLVQRGIRITAKGSYHAFGRWLWAMTQSPYLLTFHDFELADVNVADGSVLRLQLYAKTYRAKSKQEQDSQGGADGDL